MTSYTDDAFDPRRHMISDAAVSALADAIMAWEDAEAARLREHLLAAGIEHEQVPAVRAA